MISFVCPACKKALKVKDELTGKSGKCPACGEPILVPAGHGKRAEASRVAPVSVSGSSPAHERTLPPRQPAAGVETMDGGVSTHGFPGGSGGQNTALADFLAPSQLPDEIGRLGSYRVLAILGHGGMGAVYRAQDLHLERLVALKVMLPALASDPNSRERFLREAKTAAAIDHDHIIHIYQVGEDRGVPFIAMQLLEGQPLDVRLNNGPPLSLSEVLRLGRETALGLAAAHKRGLIHRDIKPANLWLEGETGRVKILDFGLARAMADEAHLTRTGAILGTPAFMAPEQAGGREVDHRCDLFSLGCVLYRMCTGEMAFKGKDTISIISALALETPRPPHEINPKVPRALSDLVMQLLAKDPKDRPPSAQVVAEKLAGLAQKPASAAPKRITEKRLPRRSSMARPPSNRWLIGGLVGVGVLLVALVGLWLAGVFKVKTKDGTIVLENLPADAEVLVDGQTVTFQAVDGKPIAITAGKKHQLQVKKEGFKVFGQEVEIDAGRRLPIRVSLEPASETTSRTPLPSPEHLAQDRDFMPLFNGKDLTGWEKVGKGEWLVEKGILRTAGEEKPGYLASEHDYGDFELALEYRVGPRGNSGVFIHAWKEGDPYGGQFLEIQLIDDKGYNTVGKSNGTASIFGVVAPRPTVQSLLNTWHKMTIRAQGRRMQVSFDGQQVIDANLDDYSASFERFPGLKRATGRIGLQHYGTPVEFRKIEVKELPPTAALEKETRPTAVDRKPYFIDGGPWRVQGDELVQTDPKPGFSHLIFGDPEWDDYDFSVDAMCVGGDIRIHFAMFVRCTKDFYLFGLFRNSCQLEFQRPMRTLATSNVGLVNGVWYTYRVRVRGNLIQCFRKAGDKEVLVFSFMDDGRHPKGRVALRTSWAAFRFRNIKVTGPDGKVLWDGPPALRSP